ncbi:MAG: hypothetical protein AAB632_01190 [Patescibacteria group bacterium]
MGATIGSSCHHRKAPDWGFVLFMLSLVLMILGGVVGVIVGLFFSGSMIFGHSAMWAAISLLAAGGVIFLGLFAVGISRG